MPISTSQQARQQLRRELKNKRQLLNNAEVQRDSRLIAKNLWACHVLSRAKRVAVYLAMPGEVDCRWIVEGARLRKMRIFAPVLSNGKLLFAPLETQSKFANNCYGIAEPTAPANKLLRGQHLDAVIVPLLAFDSAKNRIGMGGGYYDRTFAFRNRRSKWKRPLLIGVAYSFQQVNDFRAAIWDVPLDTVVTEQQLLEKH